MYRLACVEGGKERHPVILGICVHVCREGRREGGEFHPASDSGNLCVQACMCVGREGGREGGRGVPSSYSDSGNLCVQKEIRV